MPKKSRGDFIRASVGYYLKNKSYVGERLRRSDIVLLQNRREFMLQTMQNNDLERGNNFTYSNHTIANSQQITEQFGRFTQFVESQTEGIRQELRRFYAPMLCHLYIDLLKAREHKAANEFLKKFAHLVAQVESYDVPYTSTKVNGCTTSNDSVTGDSLACTQIRFVNTKLEDAEEVDPELEYFKNFLQTLSTLTQIEIAEGDSGVSEFRSSKYEMHISAKASEALTDFLEKRGHVLILNLLYSWIQVHVVDNEHIKWTEDSIMLGAALDEELDDEITSPKPTVKIKTEPGTRYAAKRSTNTAMQPPPILEVKVEQTEKFEADESNKGTGCNIPMCLDTIRVSKEKICKSQIVFPRCIKIGEKNRGLTSAQLDQKECHMVAGFNNSAVRLWQLNQHTCSGRNLYRSRAETTCPWELNNYNKEEEDAILLDIQDHTRTDNDRSKRKFYEDKYEGNSYDEYGGIYMRGHSQGVTDVRFSTHYPILYSVSKDATMRCWHAESLNCAAVYRGHRYPIWCFDESPMGTYVATGSKDLTARLWSTEREYPLITFTGHTQDVECIAFHLNGNYIATGSADLSVRLWCTTSGKLMRVFTDCKQAVTCVAFSPDGKLLAAAGEETKVRIFDLAAGAQLSELKDHSSSVTSIAWNSTGRQLATTCRDGTIRLWDTKRLLTAHGDSWSSTPSNSSSSSSSPSRLLALNSNCQRIVKVSFGRNETICCIGC